MDGEDDLTPEQREIKRIQDTEQSRSWLADFYPPLWWNMYNNLQKEGFEEAKAFELLKTYILSGNIKYER